MIPRCPVTYCKWRENGYCPFEGSEQECPLVKDWNINEQERRARGNEDKTD